MGGRSGWGEGLGEGLGVGWTEERRRGVEGGVVLSYVRSYSRNEE